MEKGDGCLCCGGHSRRLWIYFRKHRTNACFENRKRERASRTVVTGETQYEYEKIWNSRSELERHTINDDTVLKVIYSGKGINQAAVKLTDTDEVLPGRFSDYHILSINGYLLGGCHDGRWIAWEELYPLMPEENTYKIYVNGQYQGTELGRKEPETYVELYSGPRIDFPDSGYGFDRDYPVVAYSGAEDLQIEQGTAISLENETYINEFREYRLKMGFSEAFQLTNIVKIDLEDDGQDEVFIQAYCPEDLTHEPMGIQYMRKVVDGKVESFMIPVTPPTVLADHFTMIGFCDMDGDGSKELLMTAMGAGYHSNVVYEFYKDGFTRIFENGGDH